MDPAQTIIQLFGGEAAISRITGAAPSAPYRWKASRERGGTGGTIPQRYHLALVEHAKANNIRLRPEHFLGLNLPKPAKPPSLSVAAESAA